MSYATEQGVLNTQYNAAIEAPMTTEAVAYFSYDEDSGYLEHATADAASKHAKEKITTYREDAMQDNEWPSEVDSVCWGVVLQKATAVDNSDEAGQESFDYELGLTIGITAHGGGRRPPTHQGAMNEARN